MTHSVFGVIGWKNNGKTTLTERLVKEYTRRGYIVSIIKHAHHNVDIDRCGSDSFRHRSAGAQEVILAGGSRFALMHEYRGHPEFKLGELLDRLAPCDLVLVEGFKKTPIPKIEVHRKERNCALLAHDDETVVAVASDCLILDLKLPLFDLNEIDVIADFIWSYFHDHHSTTTTS